LIGGHRKHSDGGYSDTSSGGSFLDETDREVSNLTDRAFRSLCIGDEAVYNDSDLCSSSPCTQRDRQLAFSQSGQDRDREDRERDELKRAAHESFSIRMQQYGQDWIHGGMYGAEIQRDPQWEVYGERTQGRVSATFQHSFVETSQQEESLGGEQLSFLGNGATELSSRQRRSRSRVSSLIRAFNSEGQRDGAGKDGQLREWNDETSWDKSALMSIQRELSEFSTSYQQNFNSGHFSSACPFSSQDTNFYSSEVAAVAHMNSTSSFMRSSHSKHSMSTQVNCNSNFFIHSECSPFKVWRDHNRFPFQQGEVSGFMHCSEFPKWYDTPMYRELSMEAQPQGPYRFEERGIRHQRKNLAPVVPSTLPRSTSTSTILQKASAVEKRCESELTGHYPHRKRTQSLGTNRLPSHRPSTASPTSDMSQRVQDTISSVKALQQKIKMMTEKNTTTGMTANQQGVFLAPNVVSSNTSMTPFNISQLLTPLVQAHQETETSEVGQYAVSPQPVEHPPVRAESRGATPDVRMCSYKSRATSLLFNLKDNRKRVKSTYSPAKFKGLETLEKSKHHSIQEPSDTVIDIPDYPDLDFQFLQVEESSRTNAASHQYVNQYHSPGLSLTTPHYQPAHTGQHSEYTLSDYQTAQMQKQIKENEEKRRVKQQEEERAAQEEMQRRAAEEEKQRRAAEEAKQRAAEEEKQRRTAEEGKQRRAAEEEKQRRAAEEAKQRAAEEAKQRAAEEAKQRAAEEAKQRAAEEEKQRRAAEEAKQRAAEEEKQRRAAEEAKQRRAAEEEKQRRAAEEEKQRRAAEEEKQRRAAEEAKQRAAEEEKQRRAAEEGKQRRAAEEAKQRRAAEEEKQRRAAERRSRGELIALDEDDSRSLISNMSEDVESFATGATDLADVRGFYDGERPESACSFSSDVSRSLGKPPTVPPKSEKALRRAKRLTTRRIKKELSKSAADSPDGVEKSLQEVSNITSSSSTEVRSSSRQAMASSHFSSPVSLAHAPTLGSKSSYHQSYPLTQRKVLQDLGSGQYFVVDVPVEVKKKTFFDPETGKYVQLNVRESGQSTSRTQPQQTYPQPQLQPQMQVKLQQQPQASPAGKPFVLYQGSQSYPQDYQPLAINSVPRNRSSAPVTLHQDQQPVRESHSYGYPAPKMGQNSEGHRYSPEKTPYMDTVNAPYESSPEGETNSQLAGSSVCENDNSAHSQCQPRDIITMSELEDFMEVSDW
uniref:DUF4585 domain-containing protein n=1 Tax=Sander lucioperca TaxID=283035 RepID=A0A8D0A749_SANLU